MKKNTARIIALALVVMIFGAVFTACAGSTKPSGTYTLKTINGQSVKDYYTKQASDYGMSLDDLLALSNLTEKDLNDFMTMSFNGDGTGKLDSKVGVASDYTWEMKDGKLLLTEKSSGVVDTCEFKNNSVTMVSEGLTMVFGK